MPSESASERCRNWHCERVDAFSRAMEAADDGSDVSSVESEANSDLCRGCFTSGESSDEELVAGCEST